MSNQVHNDDGSNTGTQNQNLPSQNPLRIFWNYFQQAISLLGMSYVILFFSGAVLAVCSIITFCMGIICVIVGGLAVIFAYVCYYSTILKDPALFDSYITGGWMLSGIGAGFLAIAAAFFIACCACGGICITGYWEKTRSHK